jgi:hypothetical protein
MELIRRNIEWLMACKMGILTAVSSPKGRETDKWGETYRRLFDFPCQTNASDSHSARTSESFAFSAVSRSGI